MTEQEIKDLIQAEIKKEKVKLFNIIENRFLYQGEYAGARKLIDAINDWKNK